jgi:magnesium transporter
VQFKLTKELLDEIREAISTESVSRIEHLLKDVHPADIADILDQMNLDDAKFIYETLDEDRASATLVELEDEVRDRFVKSLSNKEIAEQVEQMDSDDAADLIGDLSEEDQEEVIQHIEDKEAVEEVIDLLNYDEDTAGGLMQKEFIQAKADWKVSDAVVELRKQAEDIKNIYSIYVVDEDEKLVGVLQLKSLIFTAANRLVRDKMIATNIKYAKVNTSNTDVADMMEKYDLVALPVVDLGGKLVGRVTIDDVVDIIKEEADKDYQLASGISENVEPTSSIFKQTRSRLPWLIIGMLGGILGAQVISQYEGEISINPSLAYFIPLITAMGGNVGVQSSAIVVQGLANNTIAIGGFMPKILKETAVGLINGLICSVLVFGISYFITEDHLLGVTVSIALLTVTLMAGVMGTLTPLVLNKMKIDPALATGPFITTVNDVIGLFIYFVIGVLIYS